MLSNAEQILIGVFVFFIILCVVCLVVPVILTPKPVYNANNSVINITILDVCGELKEKITVSEFQVLMKKHTGICFSDYDLERAKNVEVEITRRFNDKSNIEFNLEFFRGDSVHLETRNIDLNKDYTIITKPKKSVLSRSINVKVFENSFSKSTNKLSTVEGFQATMKQYDCVPFTADQILRATSIETTAFGWSDSMFKLSFEDDTEINQHACHV